MPELLYNSDNKTRRMPVLEMNPFGYQVDDNWEINPINYEGFMKPTINTSTTP